MARLFSTKATHMLPCYICYARGEGRMPERLAHRELRNRSAEVLREVQAGAAYEVTNHGEVVAWLLPATGRVPLAVRPPRIRGGFAELPRVRRDVTTAQVLDELRDER